MGVYKGGTMRLSHTGLLVLLLACCTPVLGQPAPPSYRSGWQPDLPGGWEYPDAVGLVFTVPSQTSRAGGAGHPRRLVGERQPHGSPRVCRCTGGARVCRGLPGLSLCATVPSIRRRSRICQAALGTRDVRAISLRYGALPPVLVTQPAATWPPCSPCSRARICRISRPSSPAPVRWISPPPCPASKCNRS